MDWKFWALVVSGVLVMTWISVNPAPAHERVCAHWYGVRVSDGWTHKIERRCARWVHGYSPRVYSYERRWDDDDRYERRDPREERGVDCKPATVRVVGEASLTEKGAMDSAVRQWQSAVRYDWGEKWMDIENARGYRWRCDRASTNESTIGKIGEALSSGSGFQKRCVIVGTPCMQPVKRGDKDDR